MSCIITACNQRPAPTAMRRNGAGFGRTSGNGSRRAYADGPEGTEPGLLGLAGDRSGVVYAIGNAPKGLQHDSPGQRPGTMGVRMKDKP